MLHVFEWFVLTVRGVEILPFYADMLELENDGFGRVLAEKFM